MTVFPLKLYFLVNFVSISLAFLSGITLPKSRCSSSSLKSVMMSSVNYLEEVLLLQGGDQRSNCHYFWASEYSC